MVDRARLAAVKALVKVLPANFGGVSLREVSGGLFGSLPADQRGLAADLTYGTCRYYGLLNHWLDQHLSKPIKPSAWQVRQGLLAALYEVWFTERPDHAVLNAWPDVMRQLKAPWAAGLCNALLRKATQVDVERWCAKQADAVRYSLPDWLWQKIAASWPDQAADVASALLAQPPFTVRLNDQVEAADWVQRCEDAGFETTPGSLASSAYTLHPAKPAQYVPGFDSGDVSVQDEAAQLPVLQFDQFESGALVLDACAAPGGKTLQLLQRFPGLRVVALDVSEKRLSRIESNLARAGEQAVLKAADAADPDGWWDGALFDAILLDAPCSATGIIRRQPDLKWHRVPSDITELVSLQATLLDALWPLLKPGGQFVYATCSILPEENELQIRQFLQRHEGAQIMPASVSGKNYADVGVQLLPATDSSADGFYFSRVYKVAESK